MTLLTCWISYGDHIKRVKLLLVDVIIRDVLFLLV